MPPTDRDGIIGSNRSDSLAIFAQMRGNHG
jgi:hypothetical protein